MESNRSNVVDLQIFEGATVGSGTFLFLLDDDNGCSVSQIISVNEQRDINPVELIATFPRRSSRRFTRQSIAVIENEKGKVVASENSSTRFVLLRKTEFPDEENDRPPKSQFYNLHDTTKEVVMTNVLQWVPLQAVRSKAGVAFVFHLFDIQSGERRCCGEINSFFIRHRLSDNGKVQAISQEKFDPFYSPYGMKNESYSQRISNFTSSLTEKCFKALTASKAAHDCRSKHLHIDGINYEAFQYLDAMSMLLLDEAILPKCGAWSSKRAKKTINNDLSASNKRRKITTEARRFTLAPQVNALRLILGANFAIGPLIEAPSMKDIKAGRKSDTVQLRMEDEVRLVTCIAEEDATEYSPKVPMRQRLDHDGIDLKFHRRGGTTDFHIHFIYSRESGAASDVATAQRGGMLCFEQPTTMVDEPTIVAVVSPTPEDQWKHSINVNTEFHNNGEVCVVTAIDEVKRTIRYRQILDDSDVESAAMDLGNAVTIINQNNFKCKSLNGCCDHVCQC